MRIALLIPSHAVWGREMLQGILGVAAERPGWRLRLRREAPERPAELRRWWREEPADACIAFPRGAVQPAAVRAFGVPAILLCTGEGLPRVGPDDHDIGFAAGRHLLGAGARHCALVASAGAWWPPRAEGVVEALADAGVPAPLILPASPGETLAAWRRRLGAWLRGLPRPCGLFAGNDDCAREVAEAALRAGLRLPEDLLVLGADDDELLCRSIHPPLSSVRVPWQAVGALAARSLDQLLRGAAVPDQQELPALGVAERASTAPLAHADPLVAAVVARLRERCHEPRRLDDLLAGLGASRRLIERRFRAALGRSLLDELRRARVLRAQTLLGAGMPVDRAGLQSGFASRETFAATFRALVGLGPAAWLRRQGSASRPAKPGILPSP